MVQTRYHSVPKKCLINLVNDDEIEVELEFFSYDTAPGQSAVFYDGDYVIGGGVINFECPKFIVHSR